MANMKLSAPWIIFVREVEELFKYDEEVHVVYNDDEKELKLYVDSEDKSSALNELLPTMKTFGNVELYIQVVPANVDFVLAKGPKIDLYVQALDGNGAFSFAKEVKGVFANNLTYVVFRNKVVQYFNDDLGDIYGQCSTLYQNIAKDVFGETEGVFFCTDIDRSFESLSSVSNCEWP